LLTGRCKWPRCGEAAAIGRRSSPFLRNDPTTAQSSGTRSRVISFALFDRFVQFDLETERASSTLN
jgi:hypothetical protein